MDNFEKYIPPKKKRTSYTLISSLEIGEICFLPVKYDVKLYNRMYGHKRRKGKEFEFKEIKNGVLIKRCK